VADTLIRALVAVEGLDAFDVQRALPDDPNFELVGMTDGVDDTVRTLQSRPVDVLLVACQGREDDRSLQIIDGAHRTAPELPIIVLSTSSPNGFLRRAFDAGAADMALFPQTKEQLRFVMSKAVARAPRKGSSGPRSEHDSRLVCVLGPKGGTGKTLTSCNLAVALALAGQKVLIIDLDLQFGDVGLCLGLPPEKTMYDLAISGGSLDEDKLSDYVMTHDAGVDVLLAPARPDQASAITIELLRDVLVVARATYDFVIADTPPGFTAEVIATIDASSDLVMVGTLDSLSLKNTKLGLETLGLMEYDPKKIQLVLNRADTRVGISQHDVVAVLGSEPNIFIPSDREIPRSVNEGIPIILSRPQSYAAASFHDLAGLFVAAPAPNGAEPVGATATETSAPERHSRSLFRLRRK
jgi:pilus assembly protein CpaE